ncbi:MAG: hypothetical protein P9X24_16800 [Candidatus Hatepunaea meridiana]|nr:hypothetical protein [Candidatus Hatepunaea meridiana]
MISNLNGVIDSLSLDHKRGAAEIVEDIADLFYAIVKIGLEDSDSANQLFNRGIKRLARGQPSMAPVLNFLNRACLIKEQNGNWSELKELLSELRTATRSRFDAMAFRINDLPRVDGTLITYSNSSTVANIIIACHKFNWPRKVICSEGRPIMEGLVLAQRLTAADVPVTVYTDAALMSQIIDADAVWVGGDCLSQNGLVNKVGSRALAMLAKVQGIPFISLMSTDKLMTPQLMPFFHCLLQNPREVAADDADILNVVNEYYENIPLELVDYILTENGLSKPDDLLKSIQEQPISQMFQQLVQTNHL